jgi:hypothetical protein
MDNNSTNLNKPQASGTGGFKHYAKYLPGFLGLVGIAVAGIVYYQKADPPPVDKAAIQPVAVASAAEIHTDCEARGSGGEIFACYEVNFEDYMKANGGKKTLELLDQLQKMGGYAQTNCHPLSHKVGNIALHVYGSVPKAVPEYIPVCASGYYHGLLEEYLGTAESYETGVAEVCGTTETQPYFNWFQCTHGLGHGVMQFRDNEVPQALKDCDIIDPANQAREICYAGVFMENVTTDEKTGHPAKYIHPDDPIYPCNAVEEQYKSACYFLASSQILKINGWNFADTFKVCDGAEENYRWLCYQSLGRDVSGSTLRNKEKVKELCSLATNFDAKADCYFGAVRDFINDKGEFTDAVEMCKFIEGDFHQKCYDAIFLDMSLYKTGQEFEAVCALMPEPFKTQCLSRPH